MGRLAGQIFGFILVVAVIGAAAAFLYNQTIGRSTSTIVYSTQVVTAQPIAGVPPTPSPQVAFVQCLDGSYQPITRGCATPVPMQPATQVVAAVPMMMQPTATPVPQPTNTAILPTVIPVPPTMVPAVTAVPPTDVPVRPTATPASQRSGGLTPQEVATWCMGTGCDISHFKQLPEGNGIINPNGVLFMINVASQASDFNVPMGVSVDWYNCSASQSAVPGPVMLAHVCQASFRRFG